MTLPRLTFTRAALVLSVVLVAASVAIVMRKAADVRDAQESGSVTIGGPFTLRGAGGRLVTEKDLSGRPFAIFFGYTHCPDVCPTTLAEIDAARDEIGPDAERLQVVFVSVNSGRDTPNSVQDYVDSFKYPVLGLTGTEAEIAAAASAYRAFYEKVPVEGGDYLMNHTAGVYLMDAEGRFRGRSPIRRTRPRPCPSSATSSMADNREETPWTSQERSPLRSAGGFWR